MPVGYLQKISNGKGVRDFSSWQHISSRDLLHWRYHKASLRGPFEGLHGDYFNTSAESVYPKVDGVFEDPVIWKDDLQYHIIVNDWKGRIAYYLRSKDGFHWQPEPGEAYVPGIARYEDGTSEVQ